MLCRKGLHSNCCCSSSTLVPLLNLLHRSLVANGHCNVSQRERERERDLLKYKIIKNFILIKYIKIEGSIFEK
jgi:hypothetical protein